MASGCLSAQFLLVRMTISTDTHPTLHVVYTDDVPAQEQRHIRHLQHDQELLSLAFCSFCVVLANWRLVTAMRDNVSSALGQLMTPLTHILGDELTPIHELQLHRCMMNHLTNTARCHTPWRCSCHHHCIVAASNVTPSTHSQEGDCQ